MLWPSVLTAGLPGVSGFHMARGGDMVRRSVMFLVMALMFAPVAAAAQTVAVAQLSGTVLDESGGALPGVDVTVTQTATGMTRSVVTGGNGEDGVTQPPIGPQKPSAQPQGFSAVAQNRHLGHRGGN